MRFLFLIAFILLSLKAEPSFSFKHKFELKINEVARVEIKELEFEKKHFFDFSWTLYDYTNIIIHSRYKRWPRQFVLSLRRNLNWAIQSLIPNIKNPHLPTRLILEFKDFDLQAKKAVFIVYIEDGLSKVEAKFIDPKKKLR